MLNHITLQGRLTADIELHLTNNQKPVTSFTIAVTRDYSAGNEKVTDFVDCVAWNATAEFISKYFRKGALMIVEGKLQSRKWQDKNGNNRINWEVNVINAYFGESKRQDTQEEKPPVFEELADDEELPF